MKSVLFNAIILICAAGVFWLAALMLREDVPMPGWVPFDLAKDAWLGPVLKIFGTLLLIPPLAGLIASCIALGADPVGQPSEEGRIRLRLGPGAKYTSIGLCLMMLSAVFVALIWQNEPLGVWLFVSPMIAACFYGLVLCLVVQADYDDQTIRSIYYRLRWQEHAWSDLTAIELDNGAGDVVLRFGSKGTQRLSAYYNGIGPLIAFAASQLKHTDRA